MEGSQASLYRAEVKRARAMLLKVRTSAQLGDMSAKLLALMGLLDPLMEEGYKVLVFSQFVEMLELIRAEVVARGWPHLLLTGQTEDRGAMVDSFQRAEGASIFLISLKAGGSGLNLTAASYVVLFDPWWNPAVENQAIDRTHRIGQVNKVIAYRLLVRDTIEEKIRQLQKQKSDLATDVLGEEGFAKALTIDDFRFLLGGDEDGAPG
jgi:SNF2 family DNA or RNA helicase